MRCFLSIPIKEWESATAELRRQVGVDFLHSLQSGSLNVDGWPSLNTGIVTFQ